MNLLLDTHALIWFLEDDPQLGKRAKEAISNVENCSFVSDATVWEVGIKHAMGRLTLPVPFEELFPGLVQALSFRVLPIRHAHFYQLIKLPSHHRDPFDRLLIAQAMAEDMTLISKDEHFVDYGVPLLW